MARLLVVEDNPDIALALATLLQRHGHEVTRAGDGVEALRVAYDLHPQLVVLDIGLPRLDGWGVLSRIRELSDIPVLLLTAAGRDEDKVRGLRAGADDYLTKPFNNAELVARIDGLLRRAGDASWSGSDLGHGADRALADPARRDRRRRRRLGDPAGVRPAQHVPAPRGPGADPEPDPVRGVGRLQRRWPGAGEVRGAPAAAQGRVGRRGHLAPEVGARHRLPARPAGLTAPVLHPNRSRPKYDPVFYDSAAKALAHRPDRPFDVLVTDLHMPGMDGLELAATLRESDPELPVLLVTAHATVDSAVRAVKGSVTDFLPKPLMADTVRAAVDAAACSRSAPASVLSPGQSG